MSAVSIALQGIGLGAAMVALQGFETGFSGLPTEALSRFSAAGGPGSQIGLSDFLARFKKQPLPALADASAISSLQRRQREDELLLLGIL